MQIKSHITPQTGAVRKDMPALVKKIGKTIYGIWVYFSGTSRETTSDKIKQMSGNKTVHV